MTNNVSRRRLGRVPLCTKNPANEEDMFTYMSYFFDSEQEKLEKYFILRKLDDMES